MCKCTLTRTNICSFFSFRQFDDSGGDGLQSDAHNRRFNYPSLRYLAVSAHKHQCGWTNFGMAVLRDCLYDGSWKRKHTKDRLCVLCDAKYFHSYWLYVWIDAMQAHPHSTHTHIILWIENEGMGSEWGEIVWKNFCSHSQKCFITIPLPTDLNAGH